MHRTDPWPVLLGSALYERLGIKKIDRAMQNQIEHSPIGADDEHVIFGENMTRAYVNTPALQEAMRRVFEVKMQSARV